MEKTDILIGRLFLFSMLIASASPITYGAPQECQSSGPQVESRMTSDDQVMPDGERRRVVLFNDIFVDKIYRSMDGPGIKKTFKLFPSEKSQFLWILGYQVEVLDGKTGKSSQEFMCHANLNLFADQQAPPAIQGRSALISLSQGHDETLLPKGFALRANNDVFNQIDLSVMALNNNYPSIKKYLNFKSTIKYVDDKTAAQRGLTPLFVGSVLTVCPMTGPKATPEEELCETARPEYNNPETLSDRFTGHWMVPPGRQTLTTDVTGDLALPYDTTVHYIWMHVHPYAESMELKDITTHTTLWKGMVENDSNPEKAHIIRTDYYSNPEGLPLYRDHHYQLVTVYNNRSPHKVDAMAVLWMYMKAKN